MYPCSAANWKADCCTYSKTGLWLPESVLIDPAQICFVVCVMTK